MKILITSLSNFASYKSLSFQFSDQGLSLIQGANGSGKSTLCDAIPWVLFGRTAKDGNVDEVLSWGATEPTTGLVETEHLTVFRSRGLKPKDNDLYFRLDAGPIQRGKDLSDTQKLINHHLGFDVDLYLSGAYFHEFSKISRFFEAKAKDRRALCEQLVDLSLPKKLQEAFKNDKKKEQDSLALCDHTRARLADRLDALEHSKGQAASFLSSFETDKANALQEALVKIEAFEHQRTKTLENLKSKATTFETDLQALGHKSNGPCPHCGAKPNDTVTAVLGEKLKQVKKELTRWETQENPHLALYEREQSLENTYAERLEEINHDIALRQAQLNNAEEELFFCKQELADLELMAEVVEVMRGELVKDIIQGLQDQTNAMLSRHFEGELSILFDVSEADKVEVTVFKDGNQCVYSQLSKGQRQMLKLCFGVSVMKQVANQHGVSFDQIFFDEALDGFSDESKVKAYGLLQTLSLEYNSIFVVEHSNAMQELFDKRFVVELVNGHSEIKEEE
jgi:DNA repair exonuclease SbcCD ATPase subunit